MSYAPDISSAIADELKSRYLRNRSHFLPWETRSDDLKEEQRIFQKILTEYSGAKKFGRNSYVSPDAHVYTHYFELGDNSWVAAGAIIRGNITIGSNSSINPFAHIAGRVKIGDGVRIAVLESAYGFSHGTTQTDIPIYRQPHTSKGITIGDGTWIGASVILLDGVSIVAHSIVGGGSVVTKNFFRLFHHLGESSVPATQSAIGLMLLPLSIR